ncbi:MAG TPA: DNA polymerase I [Candidatus Binatus sp.]|uniref:DNA polymerase I n=1 Tax=Candidatus Binatus sp. TaxID=2811406 RepID=UPI002B48660E|nr:DNA polymerase I [Candidatus Binatus sp.]HKN11691.1 DNA polymerase I [Candidatus Binatus sp.]
MAAERKQLILVDGSGYIFRAFHALPPMNTSRGLPTQAVYGFIRMLLKLLKDVRPSHIAIVFDSPKKTFRDDLFAEYKANRSEAPNDLIVQIPYIHRAVDAFRIKSLMIEGFEADDVIGTLAKRAAEEDFVVTLITADKDFMQLVGPHVTLWDTMRDRRIGAREVRERFGVEPAALIDIQALTGDTIDNIKGVPGVGEKTAAALVQKFGGVKGIYENLDHIEEAGIRGAKKIAGLLAEHRAAVDLARKLVRIETDVPLKVEPDEFAWQGVDEHAAADLLRELEFHSILREISPSQVDLPGLEANAKPAATVSGTDLAEALKTLASTPRIAVDLTASGGGQEALQLASADTTVVVEHDGIASAASLLSSERPPKSCHDLKNQIAAFARHGIALKGVDFDTMLAGFLINSGQGEPSLTDLYHEYLAPLGASSPPGTNAALVRNLREALATRLEADGLTSMYNEIEMPIAPILAEMEAVGIGIDGDALKIISKEFAEQMNRLEHECYELAGREFNLNSPIQLREILFTELKLSAKGLKKTKSGFSTDADTLKKLAAVHPLPRKLIEYRTISKLKSTYADALSEVIRSGTGRIHTTWHQALVPTGRISSSDPNLQNIPTRSVEGRRIRRAFVPKPGCVFVSADYSQIDLRVMAHLSGDKTLVDAFKTGEDIHVRTATEVLGVTPDKVNAEARRLAKVINFGIIYGMGPQRLAGELGIALAEASDYIKRYFERLPGVRAWLDETVRIARTTGYVTTMYGRRRYLPELNAQPGGARAQAERIAINTPIQGTAADLIKLAMIRLDRGLRERGLGARMILQVHDELLLEAPKEEWVEAAALAKREMEGVAELKIPLKVELKSGPNWAEMSGAA